jgi:sugar phosphate isomerase/epimerase
MILGYNTNGFSNHDSMSAVKIISNIGYQSIALTVDHHCLNPFSDSLQKQKGDLRSFLCDHRMKIVIETGARFLLNPMHKHEPTMMSSDFQKRLDFYMYCIELAAEFDADCVSIWSGILRESLSDEAALERLAKNLREVLLFAEKCGVTISFEPEPGMFIDTTASFERLRQWIDSSTLKMTMDVGHLYCLHEVPIANYLQRFENQIVNVHIEDMRAGVHEHLMFGEGEMNFPPIFESLKSIGYKGCVNVELSRHSHDAPNAAKQAFDFLKPLIEKT